MKLLSVNVCLPKEIENAQLSPVAATIATGSITVMNAEVLSHEP
jgi:hypothetical protein